MERWLPVRGYEGLYEISNYGQVRSPLGIKSTRRDSKGYPIVDLYREGKCKSWRLHRLVMLAFVGPRPKGLEIRHLNGDKWDNRLDNLSYGTHAQNMQDQIAHGGHHQSNKTHCNYGHEFTDANTYRLDGKRYCRMCGRRRTAKQKQKNRNGSAGSGT